MAELLPVEQVEECTLAECPIGLFICRDELCLKTEYGNNEGRIDAYIVSSGEFFWGLAPQTIASQRAQIVRPIDCETAHRIASEKPRTADLMPGLDHIANVLNALDTEGMTPNEVRSAIYSECLEPGCKAGLPRTPVSMGESELVRALADIADDFDTKGEHWKANRVREAADRILQLEAEKAELVAILVDDPDDVSAGVPEHLIEAGMSVLEQADDDMRNYVAGETTDWDYGMEAAAVFKAMLAVVLNPRLTNKDAAR